MVTGAVFLERALSTLTRSWSIVHIRELPALQKEDISITQGWETSWLPITAFLTAGQESSIQRQEGESFLLAIRHLLLSHSRGSEGELASNTWHWLCDANPITPKSEPTKLQNQQKMGKASRKTKVPHFKWK